MLVPVAINTRRHWEEVGERKAVWACEGGWCALSRWPSHQHLEKEGLVSGRQLGGLAAQLAAHVALVQDLLRSGPHFLDFVSVRGDFLVPLLE